MRSKPALALLTAIALLPNAARGEEKATSRGDAPPSAPACRCGDAVCRGGCATGKCSRHAQSGYGLCVAPWARLTYDENYSSYYVGGSTLPWRWTWRACPEPRFPWEGTWGTDYEPPLSGVRLWWTHGRLYQDDGGQYEPNEKNRPLFLKYGTSSPR
jgi:hypothetical protein